MPSFRTSSLSLFLALPFFLNVTSSRSQATEPAVKPLLQAHAHNDYHHARPLLDALDLGFCSVEADIHLVDDKLLVGHDRKDLINGQTLEKLYLDPLKDRIQQNNGSVFESRASFTLLIDFKTAAKPTYLALEKCLAHYQNLLTEFTSTGVTPGAVTIIVSGNRPTEFMATQPRRWAAVDGRLSDLGSSTPASLMPLISDRWPSHFKWNGRGVFPPEEKAKLQKIVQKAHAAGQRLRFWATTDNTAMWHVLAEAKVDLIGTDNLNGLHNFLKASPPKAQ